MNEQLKSRLLSLLWRSLAAGLVAVIAIWQNALPELNGAGLPIIITGILGLIAGEITKALNKTYDIGGKLLGAIKK